MGQSKVPGGRISAALVAKVDSLDSISSRLERDHDIDVLHLSDPTTLTDRADDIDCIVCGPDVIENSSIGAKDVQAVGKGWVAVYDDERTALRALSLNVDRCLHRGSDPNAAASRLAHALRSVRDDRETDRIQAMLDRLEDLFFVFDPDGGFLRWNENFSRVTGYMDDEIAAMCPTDFVADDDAEAITAAIQRAIRTGTGREEAMLVTSDGEHVPYEFTGALFEDGGGGTVRICGIGQDITERKRSRRVLVQQTERLRTQKHINEVLRDVNQALVHASTREQIEAAVCENLARKEPYRFAWIGERGPAEVVPRAWAGIEEGNLDDRPTARASETEQVTAATAIRTGEIQSAQRIADDPEFEMWREAALDRGYESAIAVPLQYHETIYGVLCIYAPRPKAFGGDERAMLADLGKTIAYAISAAEQRRALVTDAVVELEFLTRDRSIGYVDISAETEGTVTVDGVSPIVDGEVAAFVTVRGADCEDVLEVVATDPEIDATVTTDHGEECSLRLVGPKPPIAETVANYGGAVQRATAEDGEGRFLVELPFDADIRAVVEGVESHYEQTELVAQRERERVETTGTAVRKVFHDELTDRQREVLRVAYLSGYFEWPRGTNGEGVADVLGISKPTFHEHIRACERKFVEAYFEHQPPIDLDRLLASSV
jgi:HTH-type transcriptional regulator, bacterioopsin transcriptional activator and related proteins